MICLAERFASTRIMSTASTKSSEMGIVAIAAVDREAIWNVLNCSVHHVKIQCGHSHLEFVRPMETLVARHVKVYNIFIATNSCIILPIKSYHLATI